LAYSVALPSSSPKVDAYQRENPPVCSAIHAPRLPPSSETSPSKNEPSSSWAATPAGATAAPPTDAITSIVASRSARVMRLAPP